MECIEDVSVLDDPVLVELDNVTLEVISKEDKTFETVDAVVVLENFGFRLVVALNTIELEKVIFENLLS